MNIPFGYQIVDGVAVINEEEAEAVRKIYSNYLSGMSLVLSARDVGLQMSHCGVKNILQNKRYLGDDFYPQIIEEQIAQAVEEERLKRESSYKGVRHRKSYDIKIQTNFKMQEPSKRYKDPIKQVEYLYSLIESEENK